jgi:hypothetical protein
MTSVSLFLGLEDRVPGHSVFSRARNERFRDHDIFRQSRLLLKRQRPLWPNDRAPGLMILRLDE